MRQKYEGTLFCCRFYGIVGEFVGKRLILLLVTVIIGTLPLFGCNAELSDLSDNLSSAISDVASADAETEPNTIVLPYDGNDSLNPFTVKTVANSALMQVLYDGLIRLNEKYEPEPVAAQEVKLNGLQCTVVLRNNLQFANGNAVTAEDVVYSCNKARSTSRFSAGLANIASVSGDKNTVVFQLKTADPLFVNLLDFPIVKKDTGDQDLPIGSGRYVAQMTETTAKLVYNTKHFRGNTPKQTEISLISMPDNEAMLSGIKTGTLSATFSDLSKGELSSAGALSTSVTLNNMVYLGFNATRNIVNTAEIRQAIVCAVDRGTVFYKGFSGRGSQANMPVHPLIGGQLNVTAEQLMQYDTAKANQLLDAAGYQEKDASGYRLADGKPIELTLLVNGDNNYKKLAGGLIREMLAAVGLKVTVSEESFSAYTASVKSGKYDLYIGEMKLLNNMDLRPILENSDILKGTRSDVLLAAYRSYLDATGTYADFLTAFQQEVPFMPLLFRSGILVYNRNISADIKTSVSDIYYNLETWG